MHMKLGLVASLAAAASAGYSSSAQQGLSTQQYQQVGKVFEHQYVQPNVEEICFSVRPVASCDTEHVAGYVKHQKVGFHCINKNNPIAKQFKREAEQGLQLPLESKTQDVQAYVEVPVRCEKINSEEKRLRKETEKTSEQKIHLVQQQDGEEESFLFEHKPWTNQLEQDQEQERQYQRQMTRKEHQQTKSHQMRSQQGVDDSDDEDLINEEDLDTMSQYSDLINKQTSMHRILKMKDEQFDRLMEHLKFIAHQNRRQDQWAQQFDAILPNVFSKTAKTIFETVLEKQVQTKQEKEEIYEQYKEVVKRIYAYVVKQSLQMKQYNQITTGQQSSSSTTDEQQRTQPEFIANKLAKNLWYKIQKELSTKQVEEVREIAEKVQQNKPQLDRMFTEEVTVAANKHQMKQLEKELTKVITAGLKMVNHNVGKDQIQNQSEEYRKYHGQEYEQEFQRQFPKLYQRLNTIQNVQTWNRQYSN